MMPGREVDAYVALGANLGEPDRTLALAAARLDTLPATRLDACSSLWRTAPVDAAGPEFANAVVRLRTRLEPDALLAALLALERAFGRERPYRHAPRTLDLDLLLQGDAVRDTPALTLPHPRIAERAFVLAPLAELLGGDWVLAGHGRLDALLHRCAAQPLRRAGPLRPDPPIDSVRREPA